MSGPILKTSVYISENYESARKTLIDEIKEIKRAVNRKTTGEYYLKEVNTSQSLFGGSSDSRTIFRKVIDFGALPNNKSKSKAHEITFDTNTKFIKIYATATDSTNLEAIPIPKNDINLVVDQTYVTITTTSDYTSYTQTYVILEYVKS